MVDGEKQLFSPDVNAWVIPSGSSYLINSQEESGTVPNAFQMQIFYLAENGFVAPSINQASVLTSDGQNFTGMFLPKVALRELGHMPQNVSDYVSMIQNGRIITFTTPKGPQSVTITQDSKYRVYMMPNGQIPDGSVKRFDTNLNKNFYWLAQGDGSNAIGIVGYDGNWTDLDKEKLMKIVLYPLAAIMSPNQAEGLYTNPPSLLPVGLTDYFNTASLSSFQVGGLP